MANQDNVKKEFKGVSILEVEKAALGSKTESVNSIHRALETDK